jgi:hypothetical protein
METNKAPSIVSQLDWFIGNYFELLYDIHGSRLFTEDGADHLEELVTRIRQLGPEYTSCYLPVELQSEGFSIKLEDAE